LLILKLMRKCLMALLLWFLFVATGCVDIEVHTKVEENGSGVQTWRFTSTALLASQIKQQIQRNPFFGKGTTKDQYKEGDYIFENTIPFQDVAELRNFDRDVRFASQGWLIKTHRYTEVWKRSGHVGGFLEENARGIVPITLKVSVELPGRITESNADSREEATAHWTIPISELGKSKILTVTSRSVNWVLVIPAIVILVGAIAGGVLFIYFTSRKSRAPALPATPCSSCGASVPAGSSFCNFCGEKIQSQPSND